jgi:hypothetical protein
VSQKLHELPKDADLQTQHSVLSDLLTVTTEFSTCTTKSILDNATQTIAMLGATSTTVSAQVNARIDEVGESYAACDLAAAKPGSAVCAKEEAVYDCYQREATRHMATEDQRKGGPWGHVFRAISSGAYAAKLSLQDCQLKVANELLALCADGQGNSSNQQPKETSNTAKQKGRKTTSKSGEPEKQ